jgi:hypothetical protein
MTDTVQIGEAVIVLTSSLKQFRLDKVEVCCSLQKLVRPMTLQGCRKTDRAEVVERDRSPCEVDNITLGRYCFARFEPIQFSLSAIRRFPIEVLYLAPEPDEPFRQLTLSIWNLFPETPPYRGKWSDIVPHLSVAQLVNEQQIAAVAEDLAKASQGKLPRDNQGETCLRAQPLYRLAAIVLGVPPALPGWQ